MTRDCLLDKNSKINYLLFKEKHFKSKYTNKLKTKKWETYAT